jgi:hypothetical protein
MYFEVEYRGYGSQAADGRLSSAQSTANLKCKLSQYQYSYIYNYDHNFTSENKTYVGLTIVFKFLFNM